MCHNNVSQLIVLCAGNNTYHNILVLHTIAYLWDARHYSYHNISVLSFLMYIPIIPYSWDASEFRLPTTAWKNEWENCTLMVYEHIFFLTTKLILENKVGVSFFPFSLWCKCENYDIQMYHTCLSSTTV